MNKLILILFATQSLLLLSSCSTIHFVNGPEMEDTVNREVWHHSALNGLIEVSPPFDVDYSCDDKQWDSITIERSFLNYIATASTPYISIYSPWIIFYECRESID
jgi:hypothetical protein